MTFLCWIEAAKNLCTALCPRRSRIVTCIEEGSDGFDWPIVDEAEEDF
jgi:hypothetical protein